jgi:hypothetical protein
MIEANGSREAVVRLLVRSHGAVEGLIDNLRCKSLSQDVAASATYADGSGTRFHAIVALRESSAQRWQYLSHASLDFKTARLSLNDSAGHSLWEGPLLNR